MTASHDVAEPTQHLNSSLVVSLSFNRQRARELEVARETLFHHGGTRKTREILPVLHNWRSALYECSFSFHFSLFFYCDKEMAHYVVPRLARPVRSVKPRYSASADVTVEWQTVAACDDVTFDARAQRTTVSARRWKLSHISEERKSWKDAWSSG